MKVPFHLILPCEIIEPHPFTLSSVGLSRVLSLEKGVPFSNEIVCLAMKWSLRIQADVTGWQWRLYHGPWVELTLKSSLTLELASLSMLTLLSMRSLLIWSFRELHQLHSLYLLIFFLSPLSLRWHLIYSLEDPSTMDLHLFFSDLFWWINPMSPSARYSLIVKSKLQENFGFQHMYCVF